MARASCKAMSLCRKRVTPCMVSACTGCATAPSRVFARCFQFHSRYMVGTDSTDSIPSGQHCMYVCMYIYIYTYTVYMYKYTYIYRVIQGHTGVYSEYMKIVWHPQEKRWSSLCYCWWQPARPQMETVDMLHFSCQLSVNALRWWPKWLLHENHGICAQVLIRFLASAGHSIISQPCKCAKPKHAGSLGNFGISTHCTWCKKLKDAIDLKDHGISLTLF